MELCEALMEMELRLGGGCIPLEPLHPIKLTRNMNETKGKVLQILSIRGPYSVQKTSTAHEFSRLFSWLQMRCAGWAV